VKAPRATYRLQLGPSLGFGDAAGVVDYLEALGVSHLYASPYLQAAAGSTHGYDVVDPTRVSEDLGGDAGLAELTRALDAHGLGQLLDTVPNHMSIASRANRLWWDVLRNGASSAFAHYFDVDWAPPEPRLRKRILVPVLEDHYGRVLERGLLRLEVEDGAVVVRYHDHAFPLAPRSLGGLLRWAGDAGGSADLTSLGGAFTTLPEAELGDPDGRASLHGEIDALDRQLRELLASDDTASGALAAAIARTGANPDALDELLEQQSYRLAFWRAGVRELDYRRFFDIDTLVALRSEEDDVFRHTHEKVLAWLEAGVLDGVRIDHVDGLQDPRRYLERVRSHAPAAWIVVEKILAADETLPPDWPVDGTTGYEFLNDVTGLLVDPRGERPLTELFEELTGDRRGWSEVIVGAKRRALRELLAPDVERLTQLFVELCEVNRRYRDYTRHELRTALLETAAHLPVYRTYVDEAPASGVDRERIEAALSGAVTDRPELDPELIELLRRILLGEAEGASAPGRALRLRFQQLTGAVTAKAVEDTAFYEWPRLLPLNEVGGDPSLFGLSLERFHERNGRRHAAEPRSLLALSTHDTKRGEDVRARLAALSEVPERWASEVREWMAAGEARPGPVPRDPAMEYLFYQTLVGAHPIEPERLLAYVEKAAREAKRRTSWLSPDAEYERALAAFVSDVLADSGFMDRVARFVAEIREAGWASSLAQKLVQLTAPGVPDLYQGSELWELTLVDPDNRRPVDFALRRRILAELHGAAGAGEVWARRESGLPKLWLVRRALSLRAERPELFDARGAYQPLIADGHATDHVIAFARGAACVTVAPRWTLRLRERGGWGGTKLLLPEGRWRDRLSGSEHTGRVALEVMLRDFPVALLVRE
jgi:(1->4)-alpha-D-glucan 1-alpha-D-glucosylmutase